MSDGRVRAVCVGTVEQVDIDGRDVRTAIRKRAVTGPVRAAGDTLHGDSVGNVEAHGGVIASLYAYGEDDRRFWSDELGRDLEPGSFGENLLVEGMDVNAARSGEHWRVGTALLQVTTIRTPCYKLAWALGVPDIVPRFAAATRPGAYLTILEAGDVEAGDPVEVVDRPDHDVTMRLLATAYHRDRSRRAEVHEAADDGHLDPIVSSWVRSRLRLGAAAASPGGRDVDQ